jgi:predicted ribosome quality control (RQC) complex YloA/Tae2 family protein
MLSLAEIRALIPALEPLLADARVQRVIQPDGHSLVLELYGWDEAAQAGGKRWLLLSAHPKFGRIALLESAPESPKWPPPFAAWVKAHVHRAFLRGARVANDDRQVALLLESREGAYELLLSLMGTRANLYALDADGVLRAALRPLDTTRPDLVIGQAWTNPEVHTREDENRWPELSGEALLHAVQAHYGELESRDEFERLASHLQRTLDRELDFARRRSGKLKRDLEHARDARDTKRYGELLKQVMGSVKPGARSVVARDYETNEDVTIELDPKLTPAQNLERYFKRYHKGLVGANMLGQQLDITGTHIEELERLREELSQLADVSALREFAEQPVVLELRKKHFPDLFKPKRPPKKLAAKKDVPSRMLPRRYQTSDGLEVWVGRSDEGNDYLTTTLAAGNDWFFHVQGYPGSHTVLRTEGRKDPPQESVLEAAELCVHFSKLRDARKVDVHVAPIKHVHKPKGAKPGLVYVNHGKSVGLRRDPARLERILKARITQ